MSEDDLVATIRGVFTPTPAIELGLAFGKVLEDPDRYVVPGGYRCRGYAFDRSTIDGPLALIDRRGVFEAKAVKAYGDCDVVSKADHLLGAHLSEFKTTTSSFNVDKYLASAQWRLMADAFQPRLITYYVFELDDHDNGVAELRDTHTFNVFPYADLHRDCCELVGRFKAFVIAKGLDGLLRQRQKDAA